MGAVVASKVLKDKQKEAVKLAVKELSRRLS